MRQTAASTRQSASGRVLPGRRRPRRPSATRYAAPASSTQATKTAGRSRASTNASATIASAIVPPHTPIACVTRRWPAADCVTAFARSTRRATRPCAARAPAFVADEQPEDGAEPRGEPVALLLDHLDVQPARDVSSIATRADDRDARHARLARERHRVLDQAAIESDERVWGNGRFETGLHAAGARRLRHDDERAVVEGIGHQGGTSGARKRCFTIPPRIPHAAPSVPRTVPLIFERPSRGW